jgi:hypothetical protein
MASAILFYRTDGDISGESDTRKKASGSTYYDPANLPSAQILTFTFPDNVLEGISESYTNNIISIPVPNSEGVRRINKQENGLKSITLKINGVLKNTQTDIQKLKTIRQTPQLDLQHPYGRIGFYSPNATEFSLDPSATVSGSTDVPATQGYTINNVDIGYIGQKKTRYSFQLTLNFGGIV